MTAAEWLVAGLRKRGVTSIATLCGHGLDPLFAAAHAAGLRLIDTRNEQTAGYVADAIGRLTRLPGVCASSSGVAVANAMAGVMNAWFDQAPLLYLSGSANRDRLGMGCFQDCDQAGLLRPITKYSRLVDVPERIEQILDEAWRLALAAPCGPVHLMLPMDVQRAQVDAARLVRPNRALREDNHGVDSEAVERAAQALHEARRPLIVAGSGVYYEPREAAALQRCAESFAIPVLTPIWDRGIFDGESEVFLGVIGALSADPGILAQADCVILAGAAADYRVGYLDGTDAPVHRLDSGWDQLWDDMGRREIPPFTEWLSEARSLREAFTGSVRASADKQRAPGRLHAVDLVDAVGKRLAPDGVLLIDGGSIGQWAHHLLADRRYPGYWLTCGRSGVVGYGVGAAMAARQVFAEPRQVVLLSGDGAFTFTVADLECAVRNRLPFVAVVADDQCWGITHAGHLRQFGQGLATQLGAVDFAGLARALGADGESVSDAAGLDAALTRALASRRVTVLHVPVSGGNPVV